MNLQTPILIITYKRLDSVVKVLESIATVQPQRLYVASNAPDPTNPDDNAKVAAVRNLFSGNMGWNCAVRTLFRTEHLAAKDSISSAITWFLSEEPEGIILEDDCVVDTSFYGFAEECLNKYRDTPNVMQISASNFQRGRRWDEASYYFSRYNHIWGWATWRRAWENFDASLVTIDKPRMRHTLTELFTRRQDRTYWLAVYDYVKSGNVDTWDYQWMFCMWANKGVSITPAVNLVENVGFGADATNTLNPIRYVLTLKTGVLPFPLTHPQTIVLNNEADQLTSDQYFYTTRSYQTFHLKLRASALLSVKLKRRLKMMLNKFR